MCPVHHQKWRTKHETIKTEYLPLTTVQDEALRAKLLSILIFTPSVWIPVVLFFYTPLIREGLTYFLIHYTGYVINKYPHTMVLLVFALALLDSTYQMYWKLTCPINRKQLKVVNRLNKYRIKWVVDFLGIKANPIKFGARVKLLRHLFGIKTLEVLKMSEKITSHVNRWLLNEQVFF